MGKPRRVVAKRTDGEITDTSSRALLATARQALAEADTLPEITQLVERAAVIRVAAQRARLSKEAQDDWGEYKLDAERKAGKMLAQMDLQPGRPPDDNSSKPLLLSPPRLEDFGIDRMKSSRCR